LAHILYKICCLIGRYFIYDIKDKTIEVLSNYFKEFIYYSSISILYALHLDSKYIKIAKVLNYHFTPMENLTKYFFRKIIRQNINQRDRDTNYIIICWIKNERSLIKQLFFILNHKISNKFEFDKWMFINFLIF